MIPAFIGDRPRRATLPLLCMLAVLLFAVPQQAHGSSPQGTVERLNAVFAAADGGHRLRRLAPDLRDIFDFWLMAKAAVGPLWQRLAPAQQSALVEAFAEHSMATYAARFGALHGESFTVIGLETGRRGTVLVRTEGRDATGSRIRQAYLTRAYKGRWMVVDVLLEGKFSQLAVARSEYLSVIRNQGFGHLLRLLREKTRALHDS